MKENGAGSIGKRKEKDMNEQLQHNLAKANAAVAEAKQTRDDRWYPQYHIAAEAGWINDPNGLCYFKGKYHVFFQHHPYSTNWGPMHWGHVTSEDLVHWKHEPIALAPSLEADRDGVFSGSAVVTDDGKLAVFYTGHRCRNGVDEAEGNLQVQCMAISEDGYHFEKQGVVVEGPANLEHFRDPKVWRGSNGDWWMVFGACSEARRGEVWLYHSADLFEWDFHSVLYQDPNEDVFMLECPDFFPIGDGLWALVYCPMGTKPEGWIHRNGHNAGYVLGTWEEGGAFVVETEYTHLDWGHEFYAPQTMEAPDGRRLLFGWMGAFVRTLPMAADRWNGQLTLPRELAVVDGAAGKRLVNRPAREVEELFGEEEVVVGGAGAPGAVSGEGSRGGVVGGSLGGERGDGGANGGNFGRTLAAGEYELAPDFREGKITVRFNRAASAATRAGLRIHSGGGCYTYVGYDDLSERIVVDRRDSYAGTDGLRGAPVDPEVSVLEFSVYVDRGSVEVFSEQAPSLTAYALGAEGGWGLTLVVEDGEVEGCRWGFDPYLQ